MLYFPVFLPTQSQVSLITIIGQNFGEKFTWARCVVEIVRELFSLRCTTMNLRCDIAMTKGGVVGLIEMALNTDEIGVQLEIWKQR